MQLKRMAWSHVAICWLLWMIVVIVYASQIVDAGRKGRGLTSQYIHPQEASEDMPLDANVFQEQPGFNAPQQVHITQGDSYGKVVIISWLTMENPSSPIVYYGTSDGEYTFIAVAEAVKTHSAYNYTSAFIHHCTLQDLEYDTKYFYKLGDENVSRKFSFNTPPESGPDVPYTFGVIGDLGQTTNSNSTLHPFIASKGQVVLFVGDCSYADKYAYYDNNRWDSWGPFIERSTAYQPWIWSAGNHDIESDPTFGERDEFKSFTHRLKTPYASSNNTSPLWYSVQRGPAYIIVLSSYSSFGEPFYRAVQEASDAGLPAMIERQAAAAVEDAAAIIFVVDGQAGVTSADEDIANWPRKKYSNKNFLLAVNKCESPTKGLQQATEFWSLGYEPIAISAISGTATGNLLDSVCAGLASFKVDNQIPEDEDNRIPAIAIIGKPNVGKSSTLNSLAGEERSIVSPISGTTRDAIDTEITGPNGQVPFSESSDQWMTMGCRKKKLNVSSNGSVKNRSRCRVSSSIECIYCSSTK